MPVHFRFSGDFAKASIYFPFAKKKLQELKDQRIERGMSFLSKIIWGTDNVLGRIYLQTGPTEDHIYIEILGGIPFVVTQAIQFDGVFADEIAVHIYHLDGNKFKFLNIASDLPVLSPTGTGYWFSLSYGDNLISRNFHVTATTPFTIPTIWRHTYDPANRTWVLQETVNDTLGAPLNLPPVGGGIWADAEWRYNYYDHENNVLVTYMVSSDKASPETLSPFLVRRDLNITYQVTLVLLTFPSYTQNNSGALEWFSPNHQSFLGQFGILSDVFYMTTQNNTGPSPPPALPTSTTMNLLEITYLGATTVLDTWAFNWTANVPRTTHRFYDSFMLWFTQETNVVGYIRGLFGFNSLIQPIFDSTFSFYRAPRNYVKDSSDNLVRAGVMATAQLLLNINAATEFESVTVGDFVQVQFWTINNSSDWLNEEELFEDNQLYGITMHDTTSGEIHLYTYTTTQGLTRLRRWEQGSFQAGSSVKVYKRYVAVIIPTGTDSKGNSIESVIFDMIKRKETSFANAIRKSFTSFRILNQPMFMIEAPRGVS
jgi:hypothetical protein